MKSVKKVIIFLLIAIFFIPYLGLINSNPSFGAVVFAPKNFDVEVNQFYNQLNWTNTNESFSYNIVERAVDQGEFHPIAYLSTLVNTYKDYSVLNGHVYAYRLKTYWGNDSSYYTPEKEAITFYPMGLEITNVFAGQVDIKWQVPTLNLSRNVDYKTIVERQKIDEKTWVVLAILSADETSYRDTTVLDDTYYRYRVRMRYDTDIYSSYIPNAVGQSTLTPYALTTSIWAYGLQNGNIKIMWDMSNADSGRAILERKTLASGYTAIFNTKQSSYLDTLVVPGQTYIYRLCLQSKEGQRSEYTQEIQITAEYVPTPVDFTVNPIASNQVVLSWSYPHAVETGFEIWRKSEKGAENSAGWIKLATLPKNAATYSDRTTTYKESYTYRIRAFRGENAYSEFSRDTSIINTFPDQPGPLICFASRGVLSIYSRDMVPEDTTYTLEFKQDPYSKWEDIVTQAEGYLKHVYVYDASANYYYRIRANIDTLESFSEEFHFVGSLPEKPVSLSAPHVGYSRVLLKWEDITEKERGYNIYRNDNGVRKKIGTVDRDTQTFIDESPIIGVNTYYEVRAYNLIGESQAIGNSVKVPNKINYKDIDPYKWAHKDIDVLQGLGAFGKIQNDYFNAQNVVTRGELAYMIIKSFNIEYDTSVIFPLADITAHHKYYNELSTLAKLGIMHPDPEGRIFAQSAVTRKEAILILNNVLAYMDQSLYQYDDEILEQFTDYPQISTEDYKMLASFVGEKIITGKSDRKLDLLSNATKVEVTAFIYRTLVKYVLMG